eukprot:c53508_g1_i1 orf=204-428(+)
MGGDVVAPSKGMSSHPKEGHVGGVGEVEKESCRAVSFQEEVAHPVAIEWRQEDEKRAMAGRGELVHEDWPALGA